MAHISLFSQWSVEPWEFLLYGCQGKFPLALVALVVRVVGVLLYFIHLIEVSSSAFIAINTSTYFHKNL